MDIASLLAEYYAVKKELNRLTIVKETLNKEIKEYMGNEGTKKLLVREYKSIVTDCCREHFDLKTARMEIDEETLSPFIRYIEYQSLRVTKLPRSVYMMLEMYKKRG